MNKKKVLVIDDEEVVRELVKDVLEDVGYCVLLAADGDAGIALAKNETPQIILLDINMPKISGCAVCTVLATDSKTKGIPIVFLTGFISAEEARSLSHQWEGHALLTKPFDNTTLISTVRGIVAP